MPLFKKFPTRKPTKPTQIHQPNQETFAKTITSPIFLGILKDTLGIFLRKDLISSECTQTYSRSIYLPTRSI